MARAGRKLVDAKRTPSGQLSREGRNQVNAMAPAVIVRMREAAKALAIDPLWGTELGRMHLQGELSATQLEAGKRWANLARAHAAAICSKGIKAMNIGGSSSGAEPDPDSEAGIKIAERESRTVDRYRDAEGRVIDCGTRVLFAVAALCEDDRPLEWAEKREAVKGLDALSSHWGLTTNSAQRMK